jgi:small subunit ribosomal protein S20
MATHKSALKEHRQAVARRRLNRARRSRLRNAVKLYRGALAAGDLEQARSLLPGTLALVDRTAKSGAVHGNTADRTKSRLTRALNRLAAGS